VEEKELIHDFNDTAVDYPFDRTIIDAFRRSVENFSLNKVLICEGRELTYKELDILSNQMAHYLLEYYPIEEGSLIGIELEKTEWVIISILAILKTGGAYLPIDPNYPVERINFIKEDSNCVFILNNVLLESFKQVHSEYSSVLPSILITSNTLAYVIYTSGSTGKPNGVLVEHGSSFNMSTDQLRIFDIASTDVIVWFSSIAFDASVFEIMLALYSGGTLVIPTEKERKDTDNFVRLIKETNVTIATLPPSYLDLLSSPDLLTLRCLITAGESARVEKASELSEQIRYFNAYGPTECSVCVSTYEVKPSDVNRISVPIGSPIANLSIYVLDSKLQLTPKGVAGTIYVSGIGVARGYLNRPVLTKETFLDDPFIKGERMYCTGDIGRRLSDGSIEFLGRQDNQVKIRGYRVELGEIENILLKESGIEQAVVVFKEHNQQNTLVAYLVSDTTLNKNVLKDSMRLILPDYMVPSYFIIVNEIPLTPNGKIDTKLLPALEDKDFLKEQYVAPINDIEQQLVSIWERLLNVDNIGVTDNFFELGGHSLLATRLISGVRKELDVNIEINEIFTNSTIQSLSDIIQTKNTQPQFPIIKCQEKPLKIPLSFAQKSLWYIDKIESSISHHIPLALRLNGVLDVQILEASFQEIINRHEVLRTVYKEDNGRAYQYIKPMNDWTLEYIESPKILDKNSLSQLISEEIKKPIHIESDMMLRATVIKESKERNILILMLHHIAFDGWSMNILVKELIELYEAKIEDRPTSLQRLPIQYADYAIWQDTYLKESSIDKKLDYWREKLSGVQAIDLPKDYNSKEEKDVEGVVSFTIDKKLSKQLKAFCQKENVTLFMVMISIFKILLYKYSGKNDICIGSPVANRTQKELEPLIGCFLNTLAIRSDLSGDPNFLSFLKQVKKTTIEAYSYQDIPYEKILEVLSVKRQSNKAFLFDVVFNMLNLPTIESIALKGLTIDPINELEIPSKSNITLYIIEERDALKGVYRYNKKMFSHSRIQNMAMHYEELLKEVLFTPLNTISGLNFLSKAEQKEQKDILMDFLND
ncbi:non-ribosomal peptide synthetase, partial [Aquimarina sp. I32.4]|uniref:non-ribosomal peptide synthetase n=1 Tax=Aquimarina sp. I32.4 TaxID=2053903 RepID=UPI0011AFC154